MQVSENSRFLHMDGEKLDSCEPLVDPGLEESNVNDDTQDLPAQQQDVLLPAELEGRSLLNTVSPGQLYTRIKVINIMS